MWVLASKLDEPLDVDGLLGGNLDKDPGPADRVEGVQDHHHGLGVPIFLFLVYQGVVFGVEDKGFVRFVSFGCAVDCTGGGECAVGDDFTEAHGLIVFGCSMFVPHSNDDLFGTNEDLLWEGFGVAGARLVVCQELLVYSLGPCLGNLLVCGAGCTSWCRCQRQWCWCR